MNILSLSPPVFAFLTDIGVGVVAVGGKEHLGSSGSQPKNSIGIFCYYQHVTVQMLHLCMCHVHRSGVVCVCVYVCESVCACDLLDGKVLLVFFYTLVCMHMVDIKTFFLKWRYI